VHYAALKSKCNIQVCILQDQRNSIYTSIETGPGHPGQVSSGSSGCFTHYLGLTCFTHYLGLTCFTHYLGPTHFTHYLGLTQPGSCELKSLPYGTVTTHTSTNCEPYQNCLLTNARATPLILQADNMNRLLSTTLCGVRLLIDCCCRSLVAV